MRLSYLTITGNRPMKELIYFLIAGMISYSCYSKNIAEKEEITKTDEHKIPGKSLGKKELLPIKLSALARVKDTIHVLKKGETLWRLSQKYYGNRHYSSLLTRYNSIQNVSNIKSGTTIKIPTLKNLLNAPHLKLAPIRYEIEKILKARVLFMRREKMLADLRKGRAPIQLPQNIQKDLQTAATLVDEAIESLAKVGTRSMKVPTKTIGQLKSVAANLKNLAKGRHDGPYKYDLDMVHQRLVYAMKNGISWAKNNYK